MLDKFALLGVPQGFDEPQGLDEKFRALARQWHPDRFARATSPERRKALEQTTLLNDAYKTLKDPVRRAEHLLQLRGVKGEPKMSGSGVEQLAQGVRSKRDQTLAQVRELVARGADLGEAAELLARMRYYARYLDEVEGRSAEI